VGATTRRSKQKNADLGSRARMAAAEHRLGEEGGKCVQYWISRDKKDLSLWSYTNTTKSPFSDSPTLTPSLLLFLLHLYYYSYSSYYNILRMSTWQVVISYYFTCRIVTPTGFKIRTDMLI
jgi:hypothetical protein